MFAAGTALSASSPDCYDLYLGCVLYTDCNPQIYRNATAAQIRGMGVKTIRNKLGRPTPATSYDVAEAERAFAADQKLKEESK